MWHRESWAHSKDSRSPPQAVTQALALGCGMGSTQGLWVAGRRFGQWLFSCQSALWRPFLPPSSVRTLPFLELLFWKERWSLAQRT